MPKEKWEEAIDEIWDLLKAAQEQSKEDREQLREGREQFREIREQFRETDKRFREMTQETDKRFREMTQETDKRFREMTQETDKRFQEMTQETDRWFRETDKRFRETANQLQETDEEISRLADLFTGQWGRLIEALVAPGTAALFRQRGIAVYQMSQRVKTQRNGRSLEIDVLLENDDEVIVVEVKTTLKVDDVRRFLERLEEFLDFFPKYSEYHIYGGVAAVNIEEEADRFAYRQGLFVLGVVGDGMIKILNDSNFKPTDFRKEQR